MSESTNKTSDKKIIELDIPKSRDMDMSPGDLANELGWSVNTVRDKVDALFSKGEKNFSINNSGNYQMYNHECLPILKAYIGKKTARRNLYSEDEFLGEVASNLDADTSQIFCRNYLYNQEEFRRYYLGQKIEAPIQQRLDCIKNLSNNLDISPTMSFRAQGIDDAVAKLDRIIYELTNFCPPDDTNTVNRQGDKTFTNPTKRLTRKWCKELIARREKISSREGISYDITIPDSLSGLECRLSESLDENEKVLSQRVTETLQLLEQRQSFSYQLDKGGMAKLEQDIQELLLSNMENYLEAVFELKAVPPFSLTENCNFGIFILDLVRDAYCTIRSETEMLEKSHFGMNVWLNLNTLYFDRYEPKLESQNSFEAAIRINNLLVLAIKKIQDFWTGMRDAKLIPKEQSWESVFADAVNNVVLANKRYQFIKHAESSVSFLMDIMTETAQTPLSVAALLCAQSITLEYYWRKRIIQLSQEIVYQYKEYQEALYPYKK